MIPPQDKKAADILPWGAPALPPSEPGAPALVGLPEIKGDEESPGAEFLDLSEDPPESAKKTPEPVSEAKPHFGEASDLEVSVSLSASLRTALDQLRTDTGAPFVSLLDTAGFELASSGTPTSGGGSAEAGALAAGSFIAIRELATRLGGASPESFGGLLHEGGPNSFFLAPCGPSSLLLVSFAPPVPAGIVRLAARRTADALAELVS